MAKEKLVTSILVCTAFALLAPEESLGDLQIIIPNGYEIELTDQEIAALEPVAKSLLSKPSDTLLTAIDADDGEAWLIAPREEEQSDYELMVMLRYPAMNVSNYKTVLPGVTCEGSYEPTIWNYCSETSDSFLSIPGYNQIHINHESITYESVVEMYAVMDGANLESPTGEKIQSLGVHNLLFLRSAGLYHLLGNTTTGERYTVYLRPTDNPRGAKYEITEWSCK